MSAGHPVSGEVHVLQPGHKSATLALALPDLPDFYFFKAKMFQVFVCNQASPHPPHVPGRTWSRFDWIGCPT